jgi:uncharacterized protein
MVIDVNVSLSRWPTRRLPADEPARLIETLKAQGVQQAWAGSLDGMLHRDMAGVNARLADECRMAGAEFLLPFGTVNPVLPDWQEDLRRCVEQHQMRGLRLFPNYHGYTLEEPAFGELLRLAAERRLIVQIAVAMEDERTQHPLLRVAPVDVRPLARWVPQLPASRMILLNALRSVRLDDLAPLLAAGDVSVDIGMLEGVAGIEKLLQHVSLDRILFGSHFPFFYLDAAFGKVRESELGGMQREAILHGNATRLREKSA